MRQKVYSKDIILVLAATFFYMASPMLVTPLITGFTESIGASAALMGLVGGPDESCVPVLPSDRGKSGGQDQ